MPGTKRLGALFAVAATFAALAGCGSSDINGTITPDEAATLNADLAAAEQAVAVGDCTTAASQTRQFRTHVFELPPGAGTDLKNALQEAGKQLSTLIAQQCPAPSGTSDTTGEQPTKAVPPSSETSTSTTSSTTSSSTTTSGEESPSPAGGGNQNGGGNGNAGGNGQGGGNPGDGSAGGGGSTGGTGGTGGTGVGAGGD